jgi:hypothetical protein
MDSSIVENPEYFPFYMFVLVPFVFLPFFIQKEKKCALFGKIKDSNT